MNPRQKAAWFNLIVFAATVALYLAAVPLLSLGFHRPLTTAAVPAMGIFGFLGLWGLEPFFYRRRHGEKPLMDERDHML
jgi:RsiW-degrading membrane proteinase PrsW (M82 family)